MVKPKFFKHIFCMIFIILLLSGCSIVYINSQSIDEIINGTLSSNSKLKTVSLEGYSYYLPQGVSLKSSRGLNSTLYYNHKKMYLYVDLVSYFHKVDESYQIVTDAYYSTEINLNDKKGYLEITKLEDEYFIEFMYNYSKIEAYVKENDINKTLTVMGYILNSVNYSDSVIDSLVGTGAINYNEETFNIFKSNGNDGGTFLDVVEQNDDGRMNSKDEDVLNIEENLE